MNKTLDPLEDVLFDFGHFIEKELGYSSQTKKAYLYDLKQFFKYALSRQTLEHTTFEIPLTLFQEFILDLKKKFSQFQ